jgi:hypothetical protein
LTGGTGGRFHESVLGLTMIPKSPNPQDWLRQFLCDTHIWLCAGFTLFMLSTPPDGYPTLDCCLLKSWTQAPWPVCGMTRCGSNLIRGNVSQAFGYHPFGLLMIPLIVGIASFVFLGQARRESVVRKLLPWSASLRRFSQCLLAGLAIFGLVRWFCVYLGWIEFPARSF